MQLNFIVEDSRRSPEGDRKALWNKELALYDNPAYHLSIIDDDTFSPIRFSS